jgi:hypothetical protein
VTELSELQSWMAELLVRRRALARDPEVTAAASERVTGNDRLLPVDQVEIYREQFWLRHSASLVEDFPGLGGILGQDDWERLIEEYLEAVPPVAYSLRDLGNGFRPSSRPAIGCHTESSAPTWPASSGRTSRPSTRPTRPRSIP